MIDLGRIVEITSVNRVTLASQTDGHTVLDEAETYHKSVAGESVKLWVRFPGTDTWRDLFTDNPAPQGLQDFIWQWQMMNR